MNEAAYSKQFSALQSTNRHFADFYLFHMAFRPAGYHMSRYVAEASTEAMTDLESRAAGRPRKISMLGREVVMPRSRATRIAIGVVLVLCGCLGFLPILGFWMIPVGLLILSYEFATVRRWRRRFDLWWAERRGRRRVRRR